MLNDTVKDRLIGQARKLAAWPTPEQPDLRALPLHHEGGSLLGHVLIDLLEESGYLPEDISAIAAYDVASLTTACSIMHAAGARGLDIDVISLLEQDLELETGPLKEPAGAKTVVVLDLAPTDGQQALAAMRRLQGVGWQVLCALSLVSADNNVALQLKEAGLEYLVSLSIEDIK